MPMNLRRRREKVFGPGRAVPLDRNAKARIAAYARAWSARNRQPGQHSGPITRAFLDVLEALLWGFHNSRSGVCFPSYEAIAAKAECARSTVAEALKVLELAGVLTWQHRITRILVRERDLFGQWASRWRVIRTTNAYVFSDPKPRLPGVSASKSENPPGTLNQEILDPVSGTARATQTARWSVPCAASVRRSKQRRHRTRRTGRSEPPNQQRDGMTDEEPDARVINAQPWEPLAGMSSSGVPDAGHFFGGPRHQRCDRALP